jgi:hypothetical protein
MDASQIDPSGQSASLLHAPIAKPLSVQMMASPADVLHLQFTHASLQRNVLRQSTKHPPCSQTWPAPQSVSLVQLAVPSTGGTQVATQVPFVQTSSVGQTVPQAPQLVTSLLVSTHVVPHNVRPVPGAAGPH